MTKVILKFCYDLCHIPSLNRTTEWPEPIKEEGTSINIVIRLLPKPHLIKSKLNKINLKFAKQFLDYISKIYNQIIINIKLYISIYRFKINDIYR